ncbi:helix-turn-helix domain-containing protein [Streptomyces lunaelactis]|uniref:helix-turn-helix domain-containing protein n=1 Tax=Streptomyces lunaelactis TaxID=1535768 RepID=UPI0015850200|nr:helix-turn-helix domain-containing protein [Streptomyces lunaelactis]NUK72128.1 helix-turn-helix domain-containing protein [Streptomyces lunaelactis]NUK80036.1 helix-turn-helix domain-containing protein [Streptomyces lunaelactis]
MHAELIPHAQTQATEPPEPLKVKDVARAIHVTNATVYAEIKAGRLASYRVGQGRGTIRVSRAAFKQYLAERGIPTSELAVSL